MAFLTGLQLEDEPGLADPGVALDQGERERAPRGVRAELSQDGELRVAADQPRAGDPLGHARHPTSAATRLSPLL
jgi:hypothetical protein